MMKTALTTIIATVALNIPATSAAYEPDATTKIEVAFAGIEVRKGAVMLGVYDS